MKEDKKVNLNGIFIDFVLEYNKFGFTLWRNGRWVLDASTICNDGTFRVGTEYNGLNVKKLRKYKFNLYHEFQIRK